MSNQRIVNSPQLLHIGGVTTSYGANQLWYSTLWQRNAGCGPTTCSHLMWYLSQTRPGCAKLCGYDGTRRQGFLRLMEDVWHYVTPGRMGVNTTELFVDGAVRYAKDRGVTLRPNVLNIPVVGARPTYDKLADFLDGAFSRDLPVAFLNLSNGSLRNLDSWHWVTLLAINHDSHMALMYDQSDRSEIPLDKWLRSTTLGGGFVALEPT